MDSDQGLLDLLAARLADTAASEELTRLILAAYRGEDEVRKALTGEPVQLDQHGGTTPEPNHVYLRSIAVVREVRDTSFPAATGAAGP